MTDALRDITCIRQLITDMLNDIKAQLAIAEPPGEETSSWWKEREHAAAMLTKLTPLLLKMIPLEQELKAQSGKANHDEISHNDREIIERYVLREAAKLAAKDGPTKSQTRSST